MMRTVSHKDKKLKRSELVAHKVQKVAAKVAAKVVAKAEAKKHHAKHVEQTVTTAHISQQSHQKVHGQKSVKHVGKHGKHGKQDPAGDAAAEPGSVKSVADQVKELGKEMCKGRENDPKCEMFKEKTEELEEVVEEVVEQKAEEKKAEAPAAEPGAEAKPAPPVEAPESGFHGKKVAHVDAETKTDDFAKEYPSEYPWSVYIAWGLGLLLVGILIAVVATMLLKK